MGKQHEKSNARVQKECVVGKQGKMDQKGTDKGRSKNKKQMDPVGAEKMCTDSPGTEEVWLKGRSWDADLKEKGQQGDEAPAKGG